ncbi:hypothetical protein PHISCL_08914 [Aspergillus sclerotialis]|uniref:Uncharacterized protein n=1 Tax=Aspergillus sclerotialis TaxID=2070753 RepID=A0A3A2Z7Z8_9EURO|nr:hypothetical protein PHISCL_08914 [Aspergillus sclerotialis]
MENAEILVHISAPSGASDDARYRAQVDAILGFQTVSRQNISLATSDHVEQSGSGSKDALSPAPANTSSAERREDLNPPGGLPQKCSVNDSLDTPVSVVPDSQPERTYPELENPQYLHSQPRSPSAKRRRVGSPASKDGSIPTASTLRPELPKDPKSSHLPNQRSSHLSLADLPLEIHPPSPPISTDPFTTHITPTLELLAKRLSISRIFKPTHQTRDLEILERGYWFIRINILHQAPSTNPPKTQPRNKEKETETPSTPNNWDITLFTRFWAFLSDFISRDGRAGWGVWCILEKAPINVPTEQIGISKSLTLKVYTWGEIASHIYLLLFLASERKIRKMRAQWRDCSEEVVVQM